MSGREGRESDTKRSSHLERESSSKRSRRDGKPATERTSSHNLDGEERLDQDKKSRRGLKDALPLETAHVPESKIEPDNVNKELSKSADGKDGAKHPSGATEIPRSGSFFEHDERGSAAQGGRSFSRRDSTDYGHVSNPKDRSSDRNGRDRRTVHNSTQRGGRAQGRRDDKVWRHDGYLELESDKPTPARKRPAFQEKKMEPEPSNAVGRTATTESARADRPPSGNSRRDERGDRSHRELDRSERPFTLDRAVPHHRTGFPSRERERYGGSRGGYRGWDGLNERHGERNEYRSRPTSFRAEKWKHDLYDEAIKSPTQKNEEDQIAKVEALLAL
ncbi:hypothetical protein MKW98_031973 [Papaver atlanticum]|uniref:Btz domain-containing protein n=1 Tax=Papaver atlanticum TaxID=357466 RepID=A0AAD4SF36_9MAGN|nr:hypothetical protein MKW98_031973 [Papaver atlanticum]